MNLSRVILPIRSLRFNMLFLSIRISEVQYEKLHYIFPKKSVCSKLHVMPYFLKVPLLCLPSYIRFYENSIPLDMNNATVYQKIKFFYSSILLIYVLFAYSRPCRSWQVCTQRLFYHFYNDCSEYRVLDSVT